MGKYAKAVVASLIAGLGVLLTALSDDHVTATEWVMVATAAIVGYGGTWAVPNSPPDRPVDRVPTVRR